MKKYANICMITYNRLEYTKQAIDALVRNTQYPHVITVVDNNSTDGTKEYLQDLRKSEVIGNALLLDENIGYAKGANLCWLQEPDAEYCVKCDNDIVIQKKGWLTKMVRVADAIPSIGALGYNVEPISYPIFKINGVRCRLKPRSNVGGGCVMIPKRTAQLLGFWCEEYGLYGSEDTDYGYRISLAGLLNAYMVDENMAFHLPAGKASVKNRDTLDSFDGIEEQTDPEYRQWKDDERRDYIYILEQNKKGYVSGNTPLYVYSSFEKAEEHHDAATVQPSLLLAEYYKKTGALQKAQEVLMHLLDHKVFATLHKADINVHLAELKKTQGVPWRHYFKKGICAWEKEKGKGYRDYFRLGELYYGADYDKKSIRFFNKVVSYRDIPAQYRASAYFSLGELHHLLGLAQWKQYYTEGISYFMQKQDLTDVELYRVASIYKHVEDYDKAEKIFATLLQKTTGTHLMPGICFHKGEIAYARGSLDEAHTYIMKCLALNPQHKKAQEICDLLHMKAEK